MVMKYSDLAVLDLDPLRQGNLNKVRNIKVSINTNIKRNTAGVKACKLSIHTDPRIETIKRKNTIAIETRGIEEITEITETAETNNKGTNHNHSKNLDPTKYPCLYQLK